MKQLEKRIGEKLHAQRRAHERYGLIVTDKMYWQMSHQAKSAYVVRRRTNRVTVRIIEWDGIKYPVVYDSHRKQIVTFLNWNTKDEDSDN